MRVGAVCVKAVGENISNGAEKYRLILKAFAQILSRCRRENRGFQEQEKSTEKVIGQRKPSPLARSRAKSI